MKGRRAIKRSLYLRDDIISLFSMLICITVFYQKVMLYFCAIKTNLSDKYYLLLNYYNA